MNEPTPTPCPLVPDPRGALGNVGTAMKGSVVTQPGIKEVARAWDVEAPIRSAELLGEADSVYAALTDFLESTILNLTGGARCRVLDAGCGVGFVSARLAELGYALTGTDVSRTSVEIARTIHHGPPALRFEVDDPVAPRSSWCDGYDVALANMVVHNTPDINSFLAKIAGVLESEGILVLTTTDPRAYLRKQGIEHDYGVERRFEFPLRPCDATSAREAVPYWHRPLGAYYDALREAGFARALQIRPERLGGRRADDVLAIVATKSSSPESTRDLAFGWVKVFS